MKACDHKRILIAEDDSASRSLYSAIVTENIKDVEVDLAANGEEAVELFEKKRQGIVVMDQRMPVIDGIGAFKRIEELCGKHKWEMPAIILCTSYAKPGSFSEMTAPGSRHCILEKPMLSMQLLEALQARLPAGK